MKAVVAKRNGPPEHLRYQEMPDPRPKSDEILVRTTLTSLNYADIQARRGGYEAGSPLCVPGLDAVGVVEALGTEVTGLEPGQRMAVFTSGGSHAGAGLLGSRRGGARPDRPGYGLQHPDLGRAATAKRDRVVHAAAGGVGSLAVQMARALGAGRVIGTVGHPAKAEFAQRLGADEVIPFPLESFTLGRSQE